MTRQLDSGTDRARSAFRPFMSMEGEWMGHQWVNGINLEKCSFEIFFLVLCRFANSVAFHPDGNSIGVGTTDNVVKVCIKSSVLNTVYIYTSGLQFFLSDLGYKDEQVITALLWYILSQYL